MGFLTVNNLISHRLRSGESKSDVSNEKHQPEAGAIRKNRQRRFNGSFRHFSSKSF